MREIILDTETTGLDPASGHRIIEIGCVEMVHKIRTGRTFHCYVNPLRDVPKDAEAVHGITTEFLLDKPVFADIAHEFWGFLGDATLVIHNAGFDMKFLNHEFSKHGFQSWPFERVVDTLAMARKKYPGAPASLDALCRRYNIDLGARIKHGALLDAELLADVYIELCGGKQVGIDFGSIYTTATEEQAAIATVEVPAREYPIAPEELTAHQAMLGSIPQAVWTEYLES